MVTSPELPPVFTYHLLTTFLNSRNDGLSPRTIEFYRTYLTLAKDILYPGITVQQIRNFLKSLQCTNGGRHAYYRALRAYFNWLYSRKSGYNLNPQDNPILAIEAPKVEKKILPSLTLEQLDYLIE
ncbi:hypothetical protein ACFLUS_05100 [Chloroflexota bacterium]